MKTRKRINRKLRRRQRTKRRIRELSHDLVPPEHWKLSQMDKKVAVVVTVMNEEETLSKVLNQLQKLPIDELVIVINGATDQSFQIARQHQTAKVVHYPEALGHDVGRAIGAKQVRSDIYLFLDGDFVVPYQKLIPFIYAIDSGSDVALNNITPYISVFSNRDSVTVLKEFLNRILHRRDLGANSLTAVPHALSKRAVEAIGFQELAVPPKALAKAIHLGLNITSPASIDVFSKNKQRKSLNLGSYNPVADLIIGDHLEAIHYAMQVEGIRLSFKDLIRKRKLSEEDIQ